MTTQLYLRICQYLRTIIADTPWQGHVFTVGGCCRDIVLGTEIKDIDLAVDLPNGGVEFALWLYRQRLTTGHPTLFERYGTAMLRLRAFPKDDIEIVQTRAEKYTDRNSRNPQTAFGSIKDDCMRRDLTINALYYDITAGKMLDISERSLDDIKHHVIATPLDPDSTYDDDPIRILRTIRFACRLEWDIPSEIFEAMQRNASRLNIIKAERLRNEFEKILLGHNAGRALDLLRTCGALTHILPLHNLSIRNSNDNAGERLWHLTTTAIDLLPPDLTLRWAALLAKGAYPKPHHTKDADHTILQTLVNLKYHQPLLKDVVFLCANHTCTAHGGKYAENFSDKEIRRLQYLCGRPEKMESMLCLIDAFNKALPAPHSMPEQIKAIYMREEKLRQQHSDMYKYHLPFAERRIKKLLHIEPGALVQDTLEYMMNLAFDNPKRSRAEFERLVSQYTPSIPSSDTVLLCDEPRPSGKKTTPTANKPDTRSQKAEALRKRYNRHRRKKTRNASK